MSGGWEVDLEGYAAAWLAEHAIALPAHGHEREMAQMHQVTQLAYDLHRQRPAHAAQHLLALHRVTRHAGPDSARVIS